jgi:beta-N-acetylhexosaminidase
VRNGKISQERLETSVQRILQAKERFGLLNPALVKVDAGGASVKTAKHLALSRELARKSITLVRDPQGLLPLQIMRSPLIVETPAVRDLTQTLGLGGTTLVTDAQPTDSQISDIIHAAGNGRTVIIPVNDLGINTNQLKLVQELVNEGNAVIVLAHRNPFDITLLPENTTIVVTYGFNPPIREALAELLVGKFQSVGLLPVTFP